MKMLKFAALSVLVTFALISSLAVVRTAFADPDNSKEGGDNKILVTNVPIGDAIQVLPLGANIGGKGNVPDANGVATGYAPLGKISQVLLWDPHRGYVLLATVDPATTWPDTVISSVGH